VVLPGGMRARLLERFPNAKEALLKEGGDFPYLAAPEEVNLMLQVHLRSNGLFPNIGKSSGVITGETKADSVTAPSTVPATASSVPTTGNNSFNIKLFIESVSIN
jgi:hypothetical protein